MLNIEPKFIWMSLGIILIALEILGISGIGFLFAGLGAIITFMLINFNIVTSNLISNIAIFLTSSAICTLLLWKTLKRSLSNPKHNYQNIIGNTCQVIGNNLEKGKIGNVSWSGTVIKAKIDSNSKQEAIKTGSTVEIVSVEGNIAQVKLIGKK